MHECMTVTRELVTNLKYIKFAPVLGSQTVSIC
jgi:hypothetical protein